MANMYLKLKSMSFTKSLNQNVKEPRNEFINKEIYEKFLMFLQFQEEMKKRN